VVRGLSSFACIPPIEAACARRLKGSEAGLLQVGRFGVYQLLHSGDRGRSERMARSTALTLYLRE